MGFFGIASLSDLKPVVDEGGRTVSGILSDVSDATAYERAVFGGAKGLAEFGVEAVSFLTQPRLFTPGALRGRGGSEAARTLNDSKNAARQARQAGTGPRTSSFGEAFGALGSNFIAANLGAVAGVVDAVGPSLTRGFVGGVEVTVEEPSRVDRFVQAARVQAHYVGRDYNANLQPVAPAAVESVAVPFKDNAAGRRAARRAFEVVPEAASVADLTPARRRSGPTTARGRRTPAENRAPSSRRLSAKADRLRGILGGS